MIVEYYKGILLVEIIEVYIVEACFFFFLFFNDTYDTLTFFFFFFFFASQEIKSRFSFYRLLPPSIVCSFE